MQPSILDPLLFELWDLAQLAFPRPVNEVEAVFGGDKGERRVLIDLNGKSSPKAALRPELGYPDAQILDTINVVVGDLTAAVGTAVREVEQGQIVFAPGADASLEVEIRAGDDVVYHRRIDRSEQFHFIHTAALFVELDETEDRERALQETLQRQIGEPTRFGLDLEKGEITLGDDVKFGATLLASWHPESTMFMWGWANEAFPEPFRRRVDQVRTAATGFGLRALATPELLCPEMMAERLAMHATVKLGCAGAWRIPMEGSSGPVTVWIGLSRA